MHLRTKRIGNQPYLYAVDTYWNAGNPKVAFQTYLGRADQLFGPTAKPLVRTFRYGAVAVLLQIARQLDVVATIDSVVGSRSNPSVGEYLLLAALNRAAGDPCSKRAFADWYEHTSLKRLLPVPAAQLTSQRFWDAMDQVNATAVEQAFHRIAKRAVEVLEVHDSVVAFDTTNFFTYIASDNSRPRLPQRGHSKAKRHDLRQVGLALAVTQRDQLPLFQHIYAGNDNDATVFDAVFPRLLEELSDFGQGPLTWVYDGGNVSARNQRRVEAAVAKGQLGYVTSISPSAYPELLAIPVEEMTPVDATLYPELAGTRTLSMARRRWQCDVQLVMSYSPEFAEGQLNGVLQHRAKALPKLQALQAALRRRTAHSRGRKPTLESVRRRVDRILAAQHLRHLLPTQVVERDGLVQLEFQVDEAHLEHLRAHLFGRRLWVTPHLDWPPPKVVQTAHQQSSAEAVFRQLQDPDHAAWQPTYHWTDQKIRVHGLYCLIALLLVQSLRLLAHRAGDPRHVDAVLADLETIDECLVVPKLRTPDERPHLETSLSVCSTTQRRLLGLVGLSAGVAAA